MEIIKQWNKNKMQNLKLVGISTLFLMATVIGLTAGYFSSRKISDDKSAGEKPIQIIAPNVQSVELTNAELTVTITKMKADLRKLSISNAELKKANAQKVGPQGDQGVRGETGPIGPIGRPGMKGSPGSKGDSIVGPPGSVGEVGLQGERGEVGQTGPIGPNPNVDALRLEVNQKATKAELPDEVQKILGAPNMPQNLRSALFNAMKPVLKTAHFDVWIKNNINGFLELIHLDLSTGNSFWYVTGYLFTDVQESNSYLFKNLNGARGENADRYGLFGKVENNKDPVSFTLEKYSQLLPGKYKQ